MEKTLKEVDVVVEIELWRNNPVLAYGGGVVLPRHGVVVAGLKVGVSVAATEI